MARADGARHRSTRFTRRGLIAGLVLVGLVGLSLVYVLGRSRPGPDAGRLIYAARQGVFERSLADGSDRQIARLPAEAEVAVPSPDGRWVAYSLGGGELWLQEVDGDAHFRVAERFVVPAGWSPDGRLIVGELLSDQDLVAVDPDGGRRVLLSGGFAAGSVPVWVSDSRFAVARDAESFVIFDERRRDTSEPVAGLPITASPDGAELLILREGAVHAGRVTSEGLEDVRQVFAGSASFGAASPRGFLAIAGRDGDDREGVFVFLGGDRSRLVVERAVDWVGWARTGAVVLYAHDGAAYAVELDADGAPSQPRRLTREGVDLFPVLSLVVVP